MDVARDGGDALRDAERRRWRRPAAGPFHQVHLNREQRQFLAHVVVELTSQPLALEFLPGDETAGEISDLLVAPAKFCVLGAQRFLGAPPVGHIGEGPAHARRCIVPLTHDGAARVEPPNRSVLAQNAMLDVERSGSSVQAIAGGSLRLLLIMRMNQLVPPEGRAGRRGSRVAEDLEHFGIHVELSGIDSPLPDADAAGRRG